MRRIKPYYPLSHGIPRVDDRRMVSGIILPIGNGPRWCVAPTGHGPHKTIYYRFIRWSRLAGRAELLAQRCLRRQGQPINHAAQRRAGERLQRGGVDERCISQSQALLADGGYDADRFRHALAERGIVAYLPSKIHRKAPIPYGTALNRHRHKAKNMFGKLKDWRRIHPVKTDAHTHSPPPSASPQP